MLLDTDYMTASEAREKLAQLPDDASVIFREVPLQVAAMRKGTNALPSDEELDAEDERELAEAKTMQQTLVDTAKRLMEQKK